MEVLTVCALIAFLVLTVLLFGMGFFLHVLWWLSLIAVIFWLVGFAFRPRKGRWYYW